MYALVKTTLRPSTYYIDTFGVISVMTTVDNNSQMKVCRVGAMHTLRARIRDVNRLNATHQRNISIRLIYVGDNGLGAPAVVYS